jgi:PAS domain S-box-containing protein
MEIGWRWDRLSPSEKRVAELLLEGKSNKDICCEMFLSRARVQECVKRIVAKTGATSTRNAIVLLTEERGTLRLLHVLERVTEGVAIMQDGVFKFTNTAFAAMSGHTPEEVVGKPVLDFIAPEEREWHARFYELRLRGEDLPRSHQSTILCKGGEKKEIEVASIGIVGYDGRPAIMTFTTDKE